ncbi:hypothetical protein C7451_105202 [Blastomonas natatoria]|uniref:VOC domain-containing protein n=1 Tax=Blastomonas natatoria TaxID=34015 RepID=A0A2V3V6S6_9SPHN|nr:VOC family protein [Blastomonas natatoria]PXW76428.1 hypothetical protein C7451_105202 [Blastomonas natatoria]
MPNRPGDFVWYELMTRDVDGAMAFYGALLNWTYEDSDQPDRDYYTIEAEHEPIGGMLGMSADMLAGGWQPCWLGYVAVDRIDAAIRAITTAGGALHMGPMEVEGTGLIAMVADPQDVPFYIVEDRSGRTSQAYVANGGKPGHCAWNELATTDQAGAIAFYTSQFGWVKDGAMDMGPMGSYEFLRHGEQIGAVMTKPADMPRPGWAHYFHVEDIDAAARTIPIRQGEILFGPSEIPGGDFIITGRDPQGAIFSLVGPRKAAE